MKAMVGLVIAILIIFSMKLFWPSSHTDVSNARLNENQEVISETPAVEEASSSLALNTPSDDEKVKQMTAEYQTLEKERKNLKRRLARLKHEMWGLKFAPEDAKQMSEIMLNGYKLIKNPDMLGAFSSVKGIQDEIAKIKFAEKSLEQIDRMISEKTKSSKASS